MTAKCSEVFAPGSVPGLLAGEIDNTLGEGSSATTPILIVEDEPAIAESLAYAFNREGIFARVVYTYADALPLSADAKLIVLDLMLPDGSGFDLIVELRRQGRQVPIIVLSSRDAEADRVSALEAGADDYVTKPFSPREVLARARAVLRRIEPLSTGAVPRLSINGATRRALVSGNPVELTRVEFDLLAVLAEARGKVFTRLELMDRVWGSGFKISDRTIDSHVKSLRRKVAESGGDPNWIETVRGVGYRLNELG